MTNFFLTIDQNMATELLKVNTWKKKLEYFKGFEKTPIKLRQDTPIKKVRLCGAGNFKEKEKMMEFLSNIYK